ncbi:MAG: sugar phosphate isomerase/epimerase [Verrucomicrobia bacterium]|nr:sugar phosphate isomerase/epimerase [Verrucomicrobiota bacterium]
MKNAFAINAATLMTTPFPKELGFYRDAGFTEIEIWPDKVRDWMTREKRTLADARREIAAHELKVIGACAVGIHINRGSPDWKPQQAKIKAKLDFAAELGAPAMVCIVAGERSKAAADMNLVIERCRWLADQAAKRHIRISLEFLARIGIVHCMSTAIRLIRAVNRSNFGLLVDLYHYHLSESRLEDLALLPKGKLFFGHIDDARPLPTEWLTHNDRTFPGEGVLPWREMIAEIRKRTGFAGPWSIELHSDWVWKLPPKQVMKRLTGSVISDQ